MLHEVFKDIFADLLGLRAAKTAAPQSARPYRTDGEDDLLWSRSSVARDQDDSLSGIFNHYQDGVACDIYGRPV